jgi:hypothetical protein
MQSTASSKVESKSGQTSYGQFNNPTLDDAPPNRSNMSDAQLLQQQNTMMAGTERKWNACSLCFDQALFTRPGQNVGTD